MKKDKSFQALNQYEQSALSGGQYWKPDPINLNRRLYDIEYTRRENQINALKMGFEKLLNRIKTLWT